MKLLTFALSVCLACVSNLKLVAQTTTPAENMEVTTQEAFYPLGDQALCTYIMYKTPYSQEAKDKNIEGTVSLSFDVMPDSTVQRVTIMSDPGSGVGEAVKKMLEQLKFAPAQQMGMKVRMNMMMDFPVKAH